MSQTTFATHRIVRMALAIGAALLIFRFAARTAAAQTPVPTQTPDATLATMQMALATQQIQIDTLSRDLQNLKDEQTFQLRDTRWTLDKRLYLWTAVALLAGFLGYRTYNSIDDRIRAKVAASLDKQLYQLDPTMFRILVVSL